MTPASLRARVIDQLAAWQGTPPRELPAATPELAVAQGAAYYGLVRRGLATRIKGGTPRAFYIGVETGGAEHKPASPAPHPIERPTPPPLPLRPPPPPLQPTSP